MEINRQEYEKAVLHKKDLAQSPFDQLRSWLDLAVKDKVIEPTAMSLATCSKEGRPSARIVLLRHLDERGLVFFTNYNSRKAKQMTQNPFASVIFWWGQLEKQILIEGTIEKVSEDESNGYFAARPRKSQLGAWASQQDAPLDNREQLELSFQKFEKEFEGKEIPRPPFWGGFRLIPERFEFWQGRPSRLHDRFEYVKDKDCWKMGRLSP